ncbi:MAG: AMP-binding protein [Apibacter sp.]|nr:AMP-binding protein [Apibacter sp.]
MIDLNFSKQIDPDTIPCQEKWQLDIVDFLKDWYSPSTTITTKTSGSTGTPKNIKLTKKAMAESAKMTGTFLNLRANDLALLCMPSSYIAGKMMLVRALVWKLHLYCIEPTSHPLENLNMIFTFSAMTPMQVENSLEKLYLIKKLIVGGAQPSFQLVSQLKNQSTDIYESFGMTETISHIALKKISDHEEHPVFKLMPNTKIRVDERGCLCVLPPFLNEEIKTNDLISIISENEFEWKGRIDNVINSGGIKIFPEQVEKQLKSVIDSEFIISSIKDPLLGNKVVIIIAGKKDTDLEEKILDFNFANKYEKPKEFIYVDSFAKTPTGKIIRKI